MTALADSLRKTVLAQTGEQKSDVRFLFGTAYGNSYNKPPPEAYVVWQPLPVSAAQQETHSLATHLISRSSIFPRLHTGPEEVKNKVVPNLNAVLEAFKAQDPSGSGVLTDDAVLAAIKGTGLFLSQAECDQLLAMAPYVPPGRSVNYMGLCDALLGKGNQSLKSTGRPPVPEQIEWPSDQDFTVELRHRPTASTFTLSAERMVELAKAATKLCRQEIDCEKVHDMLRTHLHTTLLVDPGRPGHPDLGFKQWLAGNSVMSLTLRSKPGPIPPEVYDVFDQIIYDALGLPKVLSATQTLTSLGVSLHRGTITRGSEIRLD